MVGVLQSDFEELGDVTEEKINIIKSDVYGQCFMNIDFDHGQAPQQRPQAASLPKIEVPPPVLFKRQGEPWIRIIPEKYQGTVSGKMMLLLPCFCNFSPFPFFFNR